MKEYTTDDKMTYWLLLGIVCEIVSIFTSYINLLNTTLALQFAGIVFVIFGLGIVGQFNLPSAQSIREKITVLTTAKEA
jgi:hypothetical protein